MGSEEGFVTEFIGKTFRDNGKEWFVSLKFNRSCYCVLFLREALIYSKKSYPHKPDFFKFESSFNIFAGNSSVSAHERPLLSIAGEERRATTSIKS